MIAPASPTLLDLLSLSGGALDGHVIGRLQSAGYTGLRVRHGYVFQRLLTGDHTATELAHTLGVTQQAMSKTVSELQRQGYVVRRQDPADARRRVIALTARAEGAIETARMARRELLESVQRETDPADMRGAERVLHTIMGLLGVAERLSDRSVPDPSRP